MVQMDPKKKKIWIGCGIAAALLVLLIIIIIHYEKFNNFYLQVRSVLSVLNPIWIGIVIAYLLNPIENFFAQRVFVKVKNPKAHKALSVVFTYIFTIAIITSFFMISIPQIVRSASELPGKLEFFVNSITESVNNWYNQFQGSDLYHTLNKVMDLDSLDIKKIIQDNFLKIEEIMKVIASSSTGILTSAYTIIKDILIGFVLSIYLLSSKAKLKAQFKKLSYAAVGEEKANRAFGIMRFTDHTFGGFIQGKIIDSLIIGILTFFVFLIFRIPYPTLLAIIVGVTNVIPVFGPIIGAIPAGFIVLIAEPKKLILTILLIILIQQLDGNYIGPKILGDSTGLSALGVFVAIVVMGGYFGVGGMLIGVPVFAVILSVSKRIVDKKLAARGLSCDLDHYYSQNTLDSLADKPRKKNTFTKVVDFLLKYLKIALQAVVRFFRSLASISIRKKDDPFVKASKKQKAERKAQKNAKKNEEKADADADADADANAETEAEAEENADKAASQAEDTQASDQ